MENAGVTPVTQRGRQLRVSEERRQKGDKMRFRSFVTATAALSLTACATDGGGPLGIVAFDPNQHVAGAEPLFGRGDYMCLDKPEFLLSLYAPSAPALGSPPRASCETVRRGLAHAVGPVGKYDVRRRNEIIDALMATSEYKCGRYRNFLQTYDANINSSFGIFAQVAAIIATITTGGTAQGFAAAAAAAAGSRGTLNQAHFQNQAVGILAKAIDNVRATQRAEIIKREKDKVEDYTLMRGIQDVFAYHNSCSIIEGLKETQRAVEEVRMPSMATLNTWLMEASKTRKNMEAFVEGNSIDASDEAGEGDPATNGAVPETNGTEPETNTGDGNDAAWF
jgi:hypothetical protein